MVAAIPYLVAIHRGTAKPNVVTWLTWTLLDFVALGAALDAHAWLTAIFALGSTLGPAAILIYGFIRGSRTYTAVDALCQTVALVGIVLWKLTGSPDIAITAYLVANEFAVLPTLRHAWLKPDEEAPVAFGIGATASLITLFAQTQATYVGLAMPIALLLNNTSVAAFIVIRRRLASAQSPSPT